MEKQKSAIKNYKPVTPGLRHRVIVREPDLSKEGPLKNLTKPIKKEGGRNHHGKITIRHRGGGHKRRYRVVDFSREVGEYSASKVVQIEYDPNRTANIALCQVENTQTFFYLLAPQGLQAGDLIEGKRKAAQINLGETRKLKDISAGSLIYNVETNQGKGGKLGRSAGVSCSLIKNLDSGQSMVRLPSKRMIILSSENLATLGEVSNPSHNLMVFGKAGAKRWIGRKPVVRGTAMNAVDHPHGGKTRGSGKKGGQPRTKWGKLAKWVPTRKKAFLSTS